MKVLFPLLSGTYQESQYGLAEELRIQSGNNVEPLMLWMTQVFRHRGITLPEASLRASMKRYKINAVLMKTYYQSLRYKDIDLMDVIRINMIDTPEVKVEKLLRWAIRYLYVCEQLLKEEKIDAVVFLLGRGLFQRCLGYAARHLGIRTYYLCDGFIPGKTTHIWNTEEEVTDDLKKIPIPILNNQQQKELQSFIDEQTKVKNIASSPYDATGLRRKISSFFVLLFKNDNLVGNKNALEFAWYETLRIFRRYMAKKQYHHLNGDNYMFLPFQVFYDFHLPLYWPEYTNLEYMVTVCRDALPPGYQLVVKEHPHLKGGIPVSVLRRISRMHDVILVDVDMSSQDLVKGCSAVITNCSSIGWQAMMHDKPVVMINSRSHPRYRYYYADYGLTLNTKEEDLEYVLKRALSFKMDRQRRDSFLYHVILSRYRGDPSLCPVEYTKMTEDCNLHVVCKYLMEKMK